MVGAFLGFNLLTKSNLREGGELVSDAVRRYESRNETLFIPLWLIEATLFFRTPGDFSYSWVRKALVGLAISDLLSPDNYYPISNFK